jgi:hypothetical protein
MDIEKQKEFLAKYEELVKEYYMEIIAIPRWKHRDDGSFSLFIDMVIGERKPDAEDKVSRYPATSRS